MVNQIGRQLWQAIISAFRPAVFDRHVLALDVAGFTETLPEWVQYSLFEAGCPAVEQSHHRHRGLLRARRERPRGRRTAEQRDGFAPSHHSITSSAVASSVGGTSRPRSGL